MITLENNSKRMVVFNTASDLPLRLFPGQNNIDCESIDEFRDRYANSAAARGLVKECIRTVHQEDIDLGEATRAHEKNNDMNTAAKALMKADEVIKAKEEENTGLLSTVAELQKQVAELLAAQAPKVATPSGKAVK